MSVKIKWTLFLFIKFIKPHSFTFINGTLENEQMAEVCVSLPSSYSTLFCVSSPFLALDVARFCVQCQQLNVLTFKKHNLASQRQSGGLSIKSQWQSSEENKLQDYRKCFPHVSGVLVSVITHPLFCFPSFFTDESSSQENSFCSCYRGTQSIRWLYY